MSGTPVTSESFNREYYQYHCGDLPYSRSTPAWLEFYRPVADAIVLGLAPRKVFDAGCAVGFLVEMLWDRGVEAHGRDISTFAISEVRADVRPWCEAGSIADPIVGQYDLVLCIEVLEHMSADEALAAIRNMAEAAPRILFSSSPTDLEEETHINVRPTRYWLERFAEAGFAPVTGFDATFLCPHAMLLERSEQGRDEASLAAFAEIVRQRLKVDEARRNGAIERSRVEEEVRRVREELRQAKELAAQETARARELQQETEQKREREEALREKMERLAADVARRDAEARHKKRGPLQRAAKLIDSLSPARLRRRRRARRHNRRAAEAVRQTGLFDEAYYRQNNPDIVAARLDPATHFALHGWRERRKPSAEFDTGFYLDTYPDILSADMNPLLHYAEYGRKEGRRPSETLAVDSASLPWARLLIQEHCKAWAPIPVFADRHAAPTLTIVTDSIGTNSLFGGVGTALVTGAIAASKMGARLRVVTRTSAPEPDALGHVLQAHNIQWEGATDFVHLPVGETRPLPLGERDIVLTTSWWTTRAVLGSVDASRVLYLLQEDERMFYPYGDSRLRCAETLGEPELRTLVNTQLLFDHLADGADPLPLLRERGRWFDPAFPAIRRPESLELREGKKNFFFYARPGHDRNLYWRGLEVIDAAIRDDILSPEEWNFHFVGSELRDMTLSGGVRPIVSAKLPWMKYAELVSQMDLGLSLMDTPHPSYPPLDLAAAGAVVVTNTHGPKTSLERWSRNIIAAPPGVDALCEALREGVVLSRDTAQRLANCQADNIPRDWEAQLSPALDALLSARG